MSENLYWANQVAKKIIKEKGKKEKYVCAAGITPSGTIHIGNFREIITVDLVARALKNMGKKVRFIYSWDDYDRFRKVPNNMPKQEMLSKEISKPVSSVPDPFGCHKSYALHFEKELENAVKCLGINPEYIYQNKMNKSGKYIKKIKIALDNRNVIRDILNEYRKEPLPEDWLPLWVFCEKCGKDSTKILSYDGQYTIEYKCECGFKDKIDIRKKSIVALPWRIDWPMRWSYEKVDFEPGGKEHSTVGGSYTTAKIISKQVFNHDPPVYQMYDFIRLKGIGGKMSGSKGNILSIEDVSSIYLPEIVRFLFAGTKPAKEFAIPTDEEIFKIYDDFYRVERIFYGQKKVSNRDKAHWSEVYRMSCVDKPTRSIPAQPNFRHIVELINIHRTPKKAIETVLKERKLNKIDKERYNLLLSCAKNWLEKYAPEEYKAELQEPHYVEIPKEYKKAIKELCKTLKQVKNTDQLYKRFYEICEKSNLSTKEFFKYIYQILFSKIRGPRLAQFIFAAGRSKIAKLLADSLTKKKSKVVKETKKLSPEEEIFSQKTIVVGRILKIKSHPNADKLRIFEVDIGSKVLNIIASNDNLKNGMYVIVALPKTRVFDWQGSGKIKKIEAGNIRGVKSEAMLCAPEEIGIHVAKKDRENIIELKKKLPLGTPVSKHLKLKEI